MDSTFYNPLDNANKKLNTLFPDNSDGAQYTVWIRALTSPFDGIANYTDIHSQKAFDNDANASFITAMKPRTITNSVTITDSTLYNQVGQGTEIEYTLPDNIVGVGGNRPFDGINSDHGNDLSYIIVTYTPTDGQSGTLVENVYSNVGGSSIKNLSLIHI